MQIAEHTGHGHRAEQLRAQRERAAIPNSATVTSHPNECDFGCGRLSVPHLRKKQRHTGQPVREPGGWELGQRVCCGCVGQARAPVKTGIRFEIRMPRIKAAQIWRARSDRHRRPTQEGRAGFVAELVRGSVRGRGRSFGLESEAESDQVSSVSLQPAVAVRRIDFFPPLRMSRAVSFLLSSRYPA